MKRKDLFRTLFTKAIDLTIEAGEELSDAFKPAEKQQKSHNSNSESNLELQIKDFSQEIFNPPKRKSKKLKNNKDQEIYFQPNGLKFPPGSIQPESKFLKNCTGCSDCIFNCPYTVLFPLYNNSLNKNIPYMDVNSNACLMCKDWPCINACNFDALKPFKNNEKPKFGQAKGKFEFCINQKTGEKTCNACEESCPIDNVVKFKNEKPTFAKSCVGCGICVQSCPTYPKAIQIN
ncbi:4Fe-4S dicluster domain-containing protein [Leptospira sp. GIMC2001]|uniref:4Fe-4S dicluster domain-containing protein n=1 Tax=Leptospira sp. GIMC2001 TaxID=1513297 RepID=UPI00234A1CB2|nr:4Fe-4S dicluster domain-containing protein [Leptospira sp. GIMC2001]WCL48696.1 4Fe-4S dicluster domain-containing protein [Leptospira sp. GIMC2001]